MSLTGFTQLDTRLPPSEYGWRRRDLRSYFRYLSPHAIGLTPGPLQVPMPFASLQSLAFSLTQEDRRLFRLARIHPPSGLSQLFPSGQNSRGCTVRFMLRPAVLASTPGWVSPAPILRASRLGTLSGQVQPVCHPDPPLAYTSKRATDVRTSFQVVRYRSRDLALCILFPENGRTLLILVTSPPPFKRPEIILQHLSGLTA